jgi:hypothetical protein
VESPLRIAVGFPSRRKEDDERVKLRAAVGIAEMRRRRTIKNIGKEPLGPGFSGTFVRKNELELFNF